MKRILVFGAGKSAYFTIHYLLENAAANQWQVTVADSFAENIGPYAAEFPNMVSAVLDVNDEQARQALVEQQDIIISLLPARFHLLLAQDCLTYGKNLITPSYIIPELQAMDAEVRQKGLLFLNELGLDPGIDHMSAMHIIHRLQDAGAEILSFKSYCGGLVAPVSDDNPWHYKFSWNPFNVLRAGYDGGLCLRHGQQHYVPYSRLFKEIEIIRAGGEDFEAYLNRNAPRYIPIYGLEAVKTFIRGTLRAPDFCRRWNMLIQSGLTSDRIQVNTGNGLSWSRFAAIFLPQNEDTLKQKLEYLTGQHLSNDDIKAFEWLFEGASLPAKQSVIPVEALQKLLEEKWRMQPADKDRVVMIHEFEYRKEGQTYKLSSWMDIEGENAHRTAMAKTVGLPLALAAEMIAQGNITTKGVVLPVTREIYEPLLHALNRMGISFHEEGSKLA